MRRLPYLVCAVGFSLLFARTAGAGEQFNGSQFNGSQFNGSQFNGSQFNGSQFNGSQFNGVVLHGVDTSGTTVGSLRLDGSRLVGSYADSPDSTCAHSELSPGGPLAPSCSTCVDIVQSQVGWCSGNWSIWCSWAASSLCSFDSSDLVGATLLAETSDGDPVELRINAIQTASDPTPWESPNENADVLLYTITYNQGTVCVPMPRGKGGTMTVCFPNWQPLCAYTDWDGNYNRALAVEGVWADCAGEPGCGGRTGEDGFVFACHDVGAIAKCVDRVGYKPWKEISVCNSLEYVYPADPDGPEPVEGPPLCWTDTLADHHEACVRMLRADYCGDGVAHTVDGTEINVWDIDETSPSLQGYAQSPATRPTWGFEANWAPHGAHCIADERFHGLDPAGGTETIADYIDANCVERLDQNLNTSQHCQAATSWHVVSNEVDESGYFLRGSRGSYVSNTSKSLAPWIGPTLPGPTGEFPGTMTTK